MSKDRGDDINEPDGYAAQELVHIGDLARRLGMRVDTLRAWERRYGLLEPQRSAGNFRLYSASDEATVRAMIAEIDRGYPPAQAAKLALGRRRPAAGGPPTAPAGGDLPEGTGRAPGSTIDAAVADLYAALMSYGGARAHQLLDALLAQLTLNTVLSDVVLPCLRLVGDLWADGQVSVAQEHFATQLIRDRLLGLARDWDRGRGPRALLACPAEERHDIALICFGLVLSRSGWRVTFLGPDTPIEALAQATSALRPDLIVRAANEESSFAAIAGHLSALGTGRRLALAGRGATPAVAVAAAAMSLDEGPVGAAVRLGGSDHSPSAAVRRG